MKMKTQRTLAVSGGTVFCAALAVLIATRFAPESETTPIASEPSATTSSVNLTINAEIHEQSKPTEAESKPTVNVPTEPENTVDPEKEAADFIEGGGVEIRQDFAEPEKKPGNDQAANTSQSESSTNSAPTEAPKVTDETALTDPTKEPTYDEKQTVITPTDNSNNSKVNAAMHGQKKDGIIYINGFGWVKDNGGGGEGEYLEGMYENGNKIGSFG
ncbi:MAG: hypothetical protein K2N56_12400 [Oscillospiraceae bacterium]|nr:hypothetical protein [Oscillospiraceae bacterium]